MHPPRYFVFDHRHSLQEHLDGFRCSLARLQIIPFSLHILSGIRSRFLLLSKINPPNHGNYLYDVCDPAERLCVFGNSFALFPLPPDPHSVAAPGHFNQTDLELNLPGIVATCFALFLRSPARFQRGHPGYVRCLEILHGLVGGVIGVVLGGGIEVEVTLFTCPRQPVGDNGNCKNPPLLLK